MAVPSRSLARRFARWSLVGACVAIVLAYLTSIAYLKANEVALVFAPNTRTYAIPADLGARVQRLTRTTAAGAPAHLWVQRVPDAPDAPWVVFLHGNAANVATPGNVERYRQLNELGLHVVAPEYPGYGVLAGPPSQVGAVAAARDAWDWLRAEDVPASRIAIYGWSLGSGVATQLAADVDERGVVLEGAFTGVDDRASELYPWLPIRWISSHPFASRARIAQVGSPLLLLHARDDEIIPFAHGERLLALARAPKRLVPLRGGHIVPHRRDEARYEAALQQFFGEIFGTRSSAAAAPATTP